MSDDVWLVVGLGNPGPAYAGHRHNVGYLVDRRARRAAWAAAFRAHKSGRADVVEGRSAPPGTPGPRVVLARPRGYMNELGGAGEGTRHASTRCRRSGSSRSTTSSTSPSTPCGSSSAGATTATTGSAPCAAASAPATSTACAPASAARPGRQDVADFVLSNYSTVEKKELPFQVMDAADAVESLMTDGLEKTQQRFNS